MLFHDKQLLRELCNMQAKSSLGVNFMKLTSKICKLEQEPQYFLPKTTLPLSLVQASRCLRSLWEINHNSKSLTNNQRRREL